VGLLATGTFAFLEAPILTAVALVFSLFALVLGISFWRKLAKARLCSQNPALRIDRIEVDYRLLTERSSDYVRKVKAKVLFPVECYQAQFHWTGHGKVSSFPVKGATHVEVVLQPRSVYDICRVHFGETFPRRKEHEFIYRQEFSEATEPVRPFLGHTMDSPLCSELVLRVHLLPDQEVKKFKRQFFVDAFSNLHLWEEEVIVDNPRNRDLEYVIAKPKYHYYYRIVW
jgi:hypothetical protein